MGRSLRKELLKYDAHSMDNRKLSNPVIIINCNYKGLFVECSLFKDKDLRTHYHYTDNGLEILLLKAVTEMLCFGNLENRQLDEIYVL
jgi:hypothetical protein